MERFAIRRIVRQKPYIEADVRLLGAEPDDGPVAADVLDAVRAAVTRHVRLAMGLRGGWVREVKTPDDAEALSYFVGGLLQSDADVKQSLLEEPSTARRLRRELALLGAEEEKLKALVARAAGPLTLRRLTWPGSAAHHAEVSEHPCEAGDPLVYLLGRVVAEAQTRAVPARHPVRSKAGPRQIADSGLVRGRAGHPPDRRPPASPAR